MTGSSGAPLQILSNVASVHRGVEPGSISHYDVIPVIDIYGSVDGTDLRSWRIAWTRLWPSQQACCRAAPAWSCAAR